MENAQGQTVSIRLLTTADTRALYGVIEKLKYAKDPDYFEKCFALQAEGKRELVGAFEDGELIGYCIYNRAPKYPLFQKLNIPEIQDLNVLQTHRRKGVARAVINFCEDKAREEGFQDMGIGVGLAPSYGAAQRLYIKMGYVPDGNGVTYDRQIVSFGELRPNDDHMSLMMIKALGKYPVGR